MKTFAPPPQYSWSWIEFVGPDAADFLKRLSTAHIEALPHEQGRPTCFLSGVGRILSYLSLWRLSSMHFVFEMEGGENGDAIQKLKALIDQYTFSERYEWKERKDFKSVWVFPDGPDLKWISAYEIKNQAGLWFCHHGDKDYGTNWVTIWGVPAEVDAWAQSHSTESLSGETIESWRIHSLRPRLMSELKDEPLPLEVGLTDSVARDKGCYPGQEVIEKIFTYGSPPRRLVRLSGTGHAPPIASPVSSDVSASDEIGKVTSVSSQKDHFEALALVRKIFAKEGMKVGLADQTAATIDAVAPYE